MPQTLSQELQAIANRRRPTEDEARELPACIADDSGYRYPVELTPQQVDVLTGKELIYYCGHCTQNVIQWWNPTDEDIPSREYHTHESLAEVDDPEAYLAFIMAQSTEE